MFILFCVLIMNFDPPPTPPDGPPAPPPPPPERINKIIGEN
jgi:hypothetical protein